MMQERTRQEQSFFDRRFNLWLKRSGLIANPFAQINAEREEKDLGNIFIDRPYLHDVLGDPASPQSCFLAASRGQGKTATCRMVSYWCVHGDFQDRVLAVPYYDFNPLLDVAGDFSRVTIRHHVAPITRSIIKTLANEVEARFFDNLSPEEKSLLAGMAAHYADPISNMKLRRKLADPPGENLDWENLTPLETLQTITGLALPLGNTPNSHFQAIYILVDKLDESRGGLPAAAHLLRSLVSEAPLLESPNLAFKFFIPRDLAQIIRPQISLPPERLPFYYISWDDDDLKAVVEERLKYYSEDGGKRLSDLTGSASIANVMMNQMLEHASGSPRTLIRLLNGLLQSHVRRGDALYVDLKDLQEAVKTFKFTEERQNMQHTFEPFEQSTESAPPVPPNGLHIDPGGHIWIDGQRVEQSIPKLEFGLLQSLYIRRPDIVPSQALIQAVWPDSPQGEDEQNLRKLVDRLRKRLEPGVSGGKSRFIRNQKGRGYYLSTD